MKASNQMLRKLKMTNRATIVRSLKKTLSVNTAPYVLPGQTRGKGISNQYLARAAMGSKAIYNRHYSFVLQESYKCCLAIDCSGSRHTDGEFTEYDHILKQIIQLYYYLVESIGKTNVKVYLFNRLTVEAKTVLGRKCFSYSSYREFVEKNGSLELLCRKLARWCGNKMGSAGRSVGDVNVGDAHPLYRGNHDGYALNIIAKDKWWGDTLNQRRLLIHLSDGRPSCDCAHCGLPGCSSSYQEMQDSYKSVITEILRQKCVLLGIGVNQNMGEYYGKDNCIRTSEDTNEMVPKFINFFKTKIKTRKVKF